MKKIKLSDFEIYLLQKSLKSNKTLTVQEEFAKNAVVTKEYVEMMVAQLEERLILKSIKVKIRKLNATA